MASTTQAETTAITVTGEQIAKPFRSAIQQTTSSLSPRPKLVGILANSNAPSRAYASWTAKACEAVGIEYELREVGIVKQGKEEGTAEQGEVEEAILSANEDDLVNGIMVYYPIFGPRQDGYLQQAVSPLKDVEGLNFTWYSLLFYNPSIRIKKRLTDPCGAVQAILIIPQHSFPRPSQIGFSSSSSHSFSRSRSFRPCAYSIDFPTDSFLFCRISPSRTSQSDSSLYPSRNRENSRTLSSLQPSPTLRFSSIRSHRHRYQPFRSSRSTTRRVASE